MTSLLALDTPADRYAPPAPTPSVDPNNAVDQAIHDRVWGESISSLYEHTD